MAPIERSEQTEGGFGSGLRAKMEASRASEAPRSPGEAVVAATPAPPPNAGLDELRTELDAALAREHELRQSLSNQLDASTREVEFEQEVGRRLLDLEA